MLRPNSDTFRGILGFLVKTKMKAYKKMTVVMCCQIGARKSVAPSSGDFQRRPAPRYACGQDREKSFNKIIITPLLRLRPDFRECDTSIIFQGLLFFLLGGLGGGGPNWKFHSVFFCLKKKNYKTSWWLGTWVRYFSIRKLCSKAGPVSPSRPLLSWKMPKLKHKKKTLKNSATGDKKSLDLCEKCRLCIVNYVYCMVYIVWCIVYSV